MESPEELRSLENALRSHYEFLMYAYYANDTEYTAASILMERLEDRQKDIRTKVGELTTLALKYGVSLRSSAEADVSLHANGS